MNKNKPLATIIALVVIIATFTGCSSSVKDQEKITVTLGIPAQTSTTARTDNVMENSIKAFETANPNIKIEIKEIDSGSGKIEVYLEELNKKIDNKTAPDLFYVNSSLMKQLEDGGKLSSLDSYVDKNDIQDFEESILAKCMSAGKLYALPYNASTLVLYYNKDMLLAKGINIPPKSLDELINYCKLLDTDVLSKGLALDYDSYILSLFMLQAGGKLTEGDKIAFNSPECIKGAESYLSLFKSSGIVKPLTLGATSGSQAVYKNYAAMGYLNNAAMRYMWAQGMDLNKSSEGQNMLIAALPAGYTQGDIVEIEGFSVNKNTGHKGQAIEVVKFLSSKKLEIINAKIGTIIPVRKSVQVEFLKNNPQMEPIIKMIHATAPVEYNINTAKIQKALTDFLTKLEANPSMDVKTLLDEAVNSVQ